LIAAGWDDEKVGLIVFQDDDVKPAAAQGMSRTRLAGISLNAGTQKPE
jgi:hypothetical protein